MVGDGQEHVDRPIYDDDGEIIVWPTLDEDMEEFAEEPEVATVAASDRAAEDDTYYEVPDTVEDDQDRIDVQVEGIEDEECEDPKIGDIQQAGEDYNEAMDTIVGILMQALSTEEMTDQMSADLQDATINMETAKQTITDLCGDPETKALQTDPDTKIPQNLQELLETLTKDGKAPWLYIDDEGNLLLDGESVPKLKVVELEAQKIKADYGEFKDLTTKNFTAVNAKIDNLKVGDLDAVNATITNLKATVAEIQTLVGGHLTMDNIQSLILTSGKVTIADALIKDAMIDTVSANKINTGTINTNNVNIQSDDGSMLLQGNLQQFKDKAGNVRIQIGKDAKGDFTFVLYGADGKGQLINQNGIQSSDAIKDGLIVNSKVADNANISGSKLDISSVISSINNNTNTIKASQIKFNDTDQTLDVSFNQLKKTVETIKDVTIGGDLSSVIEQVTTNTTNIGIAQGQISSLISNTTITKTDGTVTQLKDEYNSTVDTVNKHTTAIGKLETSFNGTLTKTISQYYVSTSSTTQTGGSWIETTPTWESGKYVWQRIKYTQGDGSVTYSTPVCIQGAKGDKGDDGTGVNILDKYDTLEALKQAHPTGNAGDCYTVNGTLYTWSVDKNDWIDCGNIKGEKGDKGDQGLQGVPGTPGADGKTYYTWIRYADTIEGTGISNDPTGKTYIGFAYNKTTQTESDTPTDYTWSLIKGDKGDTGVPGEKGKDGTTYYTWIKYSDNADGTDLYDTPKDTTKYIGIATNKTTSSEGSDKTEYRWSKFKGDQGIQGDKGQSLVNSTPQWYLSTSKTTQTGGIWLDGMPSVTQDKYLWLRYKLVWQNPSQTTYTIPTLEQVAEQMKVVTSKQAKLEQSLDGFKMTVSATYATKEGLNEVKESIQNQDGYTIILSKECIVTTCD